MKYLFLLFVIFFSQNTAFGQEVYSWRDNWGRVHYGSNPPANAQNKQKLSGVVSRYSSDKLLKTRRSPSSTYAATTSKKSASRAAMKTDIAIDGPGNAALYKSDFTFKQDQENKVIQCQVTLKNAGDGAADNLYVAFNFSDGSLIPAVGPQSIAANSEAVYSLPAEMLPLPIASSQEDTNKSDTFALNSPPELTVSLTNGEFLGDAPAEIKTTEPSADASAVAEPNASQKSEAAESATAGN